MTHTRRAVLIALGALLVPIFYASAALGPNVVSNGDLETASSNPAVPQGWSTDKWGTITASFTYPVAGNGSAKAAKVQVTKRSSGDAKWYANHVPVQAGEVYQFSTDYSSDRASDVTVEYKLQNGNFSYVWLGSAAKTNNTWKTFTKQFTVPANAVSMSVLHSIAGVGVLTIDNVSLKKEGAGDPPPPTDTCPNVPGDQTTTPCADQTCTVQGGTWNGSSCDMPPPPQVAKPIIASFTVNPSTITVGSSTLLQWSVTGASSTSINNGVGTVTGSSKSVNPTETTTYVLTATNPGGSVTATTSVTVNAAPPPPTDTCPNVPGDQTTTPCADQTCTVQGGTWNGSSCDMPPPPPSSTNLIGNGNFETAGSGGAPQGWAQGTWGTITPVFTYPVTGKSGNAAKIQVTAYTSGDAKWVHPHVAVTAGKTYTYSDEYIGDKTTNITAEFKSSTGAVTYVWLGDAPAAASWTTFTKQFTVPADAVSVSIFHILNAVGSITLDNVSLVESGGTTPPTDTCPNVPGDQTTTPCADQTCTAQGGTWNGSSCDMPPPPSGTNLVANGTLETGGTAPDQWHSSKWGTHTATFTYPATGQSGRGAKLQISNYKSGDSKWVFTALPVSSHTMYEFKSDYNSNAISELNIEFKMSNGTYAYQWISTLPSTGGTWKSLRSEITVPTGAVEMTIFQALARNGTLTIDNVSLVPLNSAFTEGMVSLVFDDGLATQYQNARSILNAAGIKAVFGIITGEVNSTPYMSWTNITTLKNEGHEIAGHSRSHPDLTTLTQTQMQNEIKGSFDDLVAHSFSPKTFLYPVGGVNETVAQVTKDAGYVGARGSYWGLNTPTSDKYALYDIRLDKTTTLASAKAWIDQAIADKRWLVFELHDVVASGGDDYAITTALFQSIVNYIKEKGIKTVTLQQGLQYMAQ